MPGERPELRALEGRHLLGDLECRSRMRHTHMCVFLHVVFSTKNRRNTIRENFRKRFGATWAALRVPINFTPSSLVAWETMSICCSQFPRPSRSEEQFS